VPGFEEEIKWFYLPSYPGGPSMLPSVISHARKVVSNSSTGSSGNSSTEDGAMDVMKISAGAVVLLEKTLTALERILENETTVN